MRMGLAGNDPGQRCFAAPGGTPENDGLELLIAQDAIQNFPWTEQVGLPYEFFNTPGAHLFGKRRVRFQLYLCLSLKEIQLLHNVEDKAFYSP